MTGNDTPRPDEPSAAAPDVPAGKQVTLPATSPVGPPETLPVGADSDTSRGRTKSVPPDVNVPGYEIIDELGRGGMGVVYLARQRSLNRLVALKMVLAVNRASAGELHRFLGEAEALAAVRHPHVVQVYECGRSPEGAFLAMEHLPGGSLADHLRGSRLTPAEAATLLEKLARGVHAAHAAGIVHRDLKPGNVLFDEGGEPKVTDFGLAKRGEGSDLTATGAVMGTPAYMAPEQARGEGKLAGPGADVWALGVILYECLTGARPFVAAETWGLIQRVISDDPPTLRSRVRSIPRDLEVVCLKCLSKEPHRRYASAEAVADDLKRFLEGDPVQARPVGRARRTYLWFRKRPVAAVGLIALLLLAGTAGALLRQNAIDAHAAHVNGLVTQLQGAPPTEVSAAVRSLAPYRGEVAARLRAVVADANADPRARLNAASFLADHDPAAVEHLLGRLPEIPAPELPPVVAALEPVARQDAERFWAVVREGGRDFATRIRYAAVLARADPTAAGWAAPSDELATRLLGNAGPGDVAAWAGLLAPVRGHFRDPFVRTMADDPDGDQGFAATTLLAALFRDDPESLASFLDRASFRQAAVLVPALAAVPRDRFPVEHFAAVSAKDQGWNVAVYRMHTRNGMPVDPEVPVDEVARERARAVLALIAAGHGGRAWDLFAEAADPRLRAYLIRGAATAGIDPAVLFAQLDGPHPPTVRQAMLLALGEYRPNRLPLRFVDAVGTRVLQLYESDPDPGIHSACRWLLRQWDRAGPLAEIDARLTSTGPVPGRDWFTAPNGLTFTIVRGPNELVAGTLASEWLRDWSGARTEESTRWLIPRDFAVATTEVTVAQYQRLLGDDIIRRAAPRSELAAVAGAAALGERELLHTFLIGFRGAPSRYYPTPDCPIGDVGHRAAMCWCRLLGELEGLPEEEQCYPPVPEIVLGRGRAKPGYLERTGYRLPTEAEWEFAARAGTRARHLHGADPRLLADYCHSQANTLEHSEPVGKLKPNGFGLFDVLGNHFERCHGWPELVWPPPTGMVRLDHGLDGDGPPLLAYALRGGGFSRPLQHQRVAFRHAVLEHPHPETAFGDTGFRVVRTIRRSNPASVPTRAVVTETVPIRIEGTGSFTVKEVFGPTTVTPTSGTLPATLKVAWNVPPGWARPEVSFVVDCPDMKERLWVGREYGKGEFRFVPQRVNSLGMAFSLLPAGEYDEGTPAELVAKIHGPELAATAPLLWAESPPRRVRLTRAFGVGTTEVTVAAFRRFTDDDKYRTHNEANVPRGQEYIDGAWRAISETRNWRKPGNPTGDDYPVVYVTVPDAVRFCEWLTKREGKGYRVLTEAQWEYAARGGTSGPWTTGHSPTRLGDYAWYVANAKNPAAVATKLPNRFGLHDMLGNVFEWCDDRFDPTSHTSGPVSDPVGPADGQAVRRGLDVTAAPQDLRPGRRFSDAPTSAGCLSGFRIACEAWEPKVAGKVVGTPEWGFRPAADRPPMRLAFDDPAALPDYALVPVLNGLAREWWAYPRAAARPGTPAAFGWNTATTWKLRYHDLRFTTANPESPSDAEWADALSRGVLHEESLPEVRIAGAEDHPVHIRPGPVSIALDGELVLPAGVYELAISAGRGHRVSVEGKWVVSSWPIGHPCTSRTEVPWSGGRCRIRIETFTKGEPGEVRFDIRPVSYGPPAQ